MVTAVLIASAVVVVAFFLGIGPESDPKHVSPMGWVAVALPMAAAIVIAGLAAQVPQSGTCDPQESQPPTALMLAAPGDPVLLSKEIKIRDARDTQITLGSEPGPARAAIGLDTGPLTAAVTDTAVRMSADSFRRGDNPQVLQAVHVRAAFEAAQRVTVWLCIERGGESFSLHPGAYTGAVTVTDPRLPTTAIPFTLTISYPNVYQPLLLWCVVLYVGAAYLAVIRRPASADPATTHFGLTSLIKYLDEPLGLAATIAGGAAAIGVYVASCLTNPTWGSATADVFGLIASMFGAFVAAGTAFRFANSLDSRSTDERSTDKLSESTTGQGATDHTGASTVP